MVDNIKGYYEELDSAIISLTFAKNKNDTQKIETSLSKIEDILSKVHNHCEPEMADGFTQLLMAEYKERVYESIFHMHFDKIDYDILCEYDDLITSRPHLYDPYNHIHDPSHFIFVDKRFYSFYEMFEVNDLKILDKWNENSDYDD